MAGRARPRSCARYSRLVRVRSAIDEVAIFEPGQKLAPRGEVGARASPRRGARPGFRGRRLGRAERFLPRDFILAFRFHAAAPAGQADHDKEQNGDGEDDEQGHQHRLERGHAAGVLELAELRAEIAEPLGEPVLDARVDRRLREIMELGPGRDFLEVPVDLGDIGDGWRGRDGGGLVGVVGAETGEATEHDGQKASDKPRAAAELGGPDNLLSGFRLETPRRNRKRSAVGQGLASCRSAGPPRPGQQVARATRGKEDVRLNRDCSEVRFHPRSPRRLAMNSRSKPSRRMRMS